VNRWVEWQNFDVKTDAPNENNGETYYGGLPKKLPEQPYSKLYFAESNKFLRTVLRGLSVDIQFETIYNSRGAKIDLIPRAINRFLTESRDTDEIEATRVLVTSAGINTATLGTTGHVAVSGGVTNPPLTLTTTVQVIADAIAQALLFQINGRDVDFQRFALVVPPAKVPVIKQALTGMRVTIVPGSTGGVSMTQEIDLGAAVDVVGNKWLKTIYPSIGEGWFLVPTDGTLPTIVRAKLEGHEAPQVWVEGSNAFYYPAGGNVPELQGKFTDETWSSKVRYAVEGHAFFNEGIIYSSGTGAA
jgi:hypothetical protein